MNRCNIHDETFDAEQGEVCPTCFDPPEKKLEAYTLSTDFGAAGGDMTGHVVARVLHDGVLSVMLSFAHLPATPCTICDLYQQRDTAPAREEGRG